MISSQDPTKISNAINKYRKMDECMIVFIFGTLIKYKMQLFPNKQLIQKILNTMHIIMNPCILMKNSTLLKITENI